MGLKPNYEVIASSLHKISMGQGIFLAAMYSFYNGEDGQVFLQKLGVPNFADIPKGLDHERVQVQTELFANHTGW